MRPARVGGTVEIVEDRSEIGFPYGFLVGFLSSILQHLTAQANTRTRPQIRRAGKYVKRAGAPPSFRPACGPKSDTGSLPPFCIV
jgi:hypothetical protein